jgi:hypothetical protein
MVLEAANQMFSVFPEMTKNLSRYPGRHGRHGRGFVATRFMTTPDNEALSILFYARSNHSSFFQSRLLHSRAVHPNCNKNV